MDATYPVYQDNAKFNGPKDSQSMDEWGWRGEPRVTASWQYFNVPYYDGGYTSPRDPIPEPVSAVFLGFGVLLAGRLRQRLIAYPNNPLALTGCAARGRRQAASTTFRLPVSPFLATTGSLGLGPTSSY